MSSRIPVIITIGHLALQETFEVTTLTLQRGDIVRLKATKPTNEKPYGHGEVLSVADGQAHIRRFS